MKTVLACDLCGSANVVAIKPGDYGEQAANLFMVTRYKPTRMWCAACWPCRPIATHPACKVVQ